MKNYNWTEKVQKKVARKRITIVYSTTYEHLPPKFSCAVSNLVGQEVLLEKEVLLGDSNAGQWGVTISKIHGSVAFKQGWNAFALDQGLQLGDTVVFQYVQGLHFIVQIFDDTGCAKLDLSQDKGHSRKRFKVDTNGVNQNEHCNMSDKSSMNTQASTGTADMDICHNHCDTSNVGEVRVSTDNTFKCPSNGRSLPLPKTVKADYTDESHYMTIKRELSSTQEEHRIPTYDISSFDTKSNISATDLSNKGLASSVPGGSSLQPQPQPEAVSSVKHEVVSEEAVSSVKHQVVSEDQSAKSPLDVPKFQTNERNSDIRIEPIKYPNCNDFSSFDTKCNISATDLSNKGQASSVPGGSSLQPQPQPEAVSSVKHEVVSEDQSAKSPLDVPKFQTNEKNNDIHIEPVKYPKCNDSSSKSLRKSMNDSAKMTNGVIKRGQFFAKQRKSTSTGHTKFGEDPVIDDSVPMECEREEQMPTNTSPPPFFLFSIKKYNSGALRIPTNFLEKNGLKYNDRDKIVLRNQKGHSETINLVR